MTIALECAKSVEDFLPTRFFQDGIGVIVGLNLAQYHLAASHLLH